MKLNVVKKHQKKKVIIRMKEINRIAGKNAGEIHTFPQKERKCESNSRDIGI